MAQPTDSHHRGSSGPRTGPALAILATAPRPGLVLTGCCPPLTDVEAGALQTAWLKQIVRELPGVTVQLFGRPTDAMPMLRYFAGPGVELRDWPAAHGVDPLLATAALLLAEGHAPVVVRTADAPEPRERDLLACLEAAQRGEFVWAPDQRGAPWLCAFADATHVTALRAAAQARRWPPADVALRRGPWARTVRTDDDLLLLLRERAGGPDLPWLPVPDVQSALQFYETALGAELHERLADRALVTIEQATLVLVQRGGFAANGLCTVADDVEALHARLQQASQGRAPIAPGDELAQTATGSTTFTVTDAFGNRLTWQSAVGDRGAGT